MQGYMKKIIMLLALITGHWIANGQVLINPQLPPAGIFLKSQLWNFSITNMSAQPINVKIELVLTDAANGQRVMTATSGIVALTQQITQLQAANLNPIVYNVVDNAYNIDVNPNGFLPVGRFEVCYAVIQVHVDLADKLAEECETIEVEPISPPVLIQPADGEQIDNARPLFTWLPPAPIASFNNLKYDWVLVEVIGAQTPSEAILNNFPLHTQQNLSANSILYPPAVPALDTGKTYAWQVSAKSNSSAIAKSEVFSFTVKKTLTDTVAARKNSGYYVPLRRENDGAYAIMNGGVSFKYLNEINDTLAVIAIRDISGTNRASLLEAGAKLKLKLGDNYITIDLANSVGLKHKHFYLLELINSKQEHWYLKFEYRKPAND